MRGFRDRNDNINIKEFKKRLSSIKGEIRYGEPMKNHTSFKIGGPADIMVFPQDLQDLANLLHVADEEKVSLFILGKGTNILVKDGGIRGIVVNLQRFDKIMIESENEEGETVVFAEAGVNLSRLLNFTASHNLTGLEFTAGIPGSVGGAVFMNAGSFDGEIKDVLKQVR
ncbi:MAG: FAD-binding protein, partial [Nitrospirae bacterium]|nr:FAD-binding protein [Nitrospirota bacterium]